MSNLKNFAPNILNSKKLLKILPWFGRLLMLFGIIFVAKKLGYYLSVFSQSLLKPIFWQTTLTLSLIYGIAQLLNAFGWMFLLRAQRVWHFVLRWKEVYSLYGKTQIAKYIPGNIFHFVGRHILTNKQGLNHATLVVANGMEILFQTLSASLISFLAIRRIVEIAHPYIGLKIGHIIIACFGLIAILGFALLFRNHDVIKIYKKFHWQYLIVSQACYFTFLIFASFLFLVTLAITSESLVTILKDWNLIMGGYAIAWLVGFLIPGAPAGIGIRETILLILLMGCLSESNLLKGIIMFRIVTLLGDIVFYLLAFLFDPKKKVTI
jgi:glycosyltransferase 2 family protein